MAAAVSAEPAQRFPYRRVLAGILVPAAGIALLAGVLVRGDRPTETADRRVAPRFTLPGVADPEATVTLPAGKPVVLYFFASWCVPCRRELPVVAGAAAARDDVAFVGVNHLDQRDDAREFMTAHGGASLPAGHDPAGDVAVSYRLRGLPATVFVDAEGRIASTLHGELDRATLDARIDDLLQGVTLQGSQD